MDIDFTKCKAQELAYEHLQPGNTVCIPWGRGIGKSWFTRLICYLLVCKWDGKAREDTDELGVRIVILMPNLVQAKKVHSQLLLSELEGRWKFLGATVNKTEWRVSFPGGSWIQFVSAEVADSARGIRCDVVFVDEADDVDPEVVESVTQPWFSEPRSLRITIIGGTPRRGRYGLLYRAGWQWPSVQYWRNYDEGSLTEEEVQETVSKHFSFHATAYDAPKLVDPKYLAQVKRKTNKTVFAREWLCDPDSAEGLVLPMFNPAIHVQQPWLPFHTILVGGDHGFEDPAVFLAIGVSGYGRDAIAHVLWEYYKTHQTVGDLEVQAARINETYPSAKWYMDSSGADKIESYKRVIKKDIKAATHTIEDGVSVFANMLALRSNEFGEEKPHLYISPSCPNLIREMGLYRRKRDPKNKERVLDDIEDKDNHAIDSARYPLYHFFGGIYNIKNIVHEYKSAVGNNRPQYT